MAKKFVPFTTLTVPQKTFLEDHLRGTGRTMTEAQARATYDIQNLRARTERQVADARNYAVQKFARDVVEAADNLRRGLEALPPPQEGEPELLTKLRDGFEGVERSFLSLLERNGVVRKDAAGQPFDPELHQAMAEQPAIRHRFRRARTLRVAMAVSLLCMLALLGNFTGSQFIYFQF